MATCEATGISVDLRYDTGKFVNGANLDRETLEPKDPKFIEQGPKGWTITVGGYGITDPRTERDRLYPLAEAVAQGLYMVKTIIKEKGVEGEQIRTDGL